MESNTNLISTGTPAWAPLAVAPIPMHQGTGLPFAGYASVAPKAARTADVKVPDPRGRKR